MKRRVYFLIFFLLGFSACGAPMEVPTEPAPVPTQAIVSPTQQIPAPEDALQPALTESRMLTLEFPPKMRAGVEGDVIRLTLEVDDLGNLTATAEYTDNQTAGEVIQIPDLYDTHRVTAEARLDMAGMETSPSGAVFEPLHRGKSATFYWSIRPTDVGMYRGTVWLHLNFEEIISGEKSRVAVSAQPVEIEAVNFFGISVSVVRVFGAAGSAIGAVIGFPFFEDIVKYFFQKRKRKKK